MTDEDVLNALANAHGNKSAAARALGITRNALHWRLEQLHVKPLAAGRIKHREAVVREGAGVYILTCAQSNTYVHAEFLANLEAYAAVRGAEIHVSRFTYDKGAYSQPSQVKGSASDHDASEVWYDPAIAQYVSDGPIRLAPDLIWCGEMNLLPTAVRPLSGLESYSGESSAVFPHVKVALESVATPQGVPAKMNYTTGTVTQRNYIEKKAGQKADFHHVFGAIIVEVNASGDWWARQIIASDDGSFYDLNDHVRDGCTIRHPGNSVHAINWGDAHVAQIDPEVAAACWGPGGVLDTLRPDVQIFNDLHDQQSRNHHDTFESRLRKYHARRDSVRAELVGVAQFLALSSRPWCESLVVSSNHDRHGERWLDEADHRNDPGNVEIFLAAQLARVQAIREKQPWDFLSWGVRHVGLLTDRVTFLPRDSARLLLGKILVSCHGDEGANGTRGSAQAFAKASLRANIGHSHTARIVDGTWQAGVCQLSMSYVHGLSSWSVSHIVTYQNGKRCIITQRAGRYWRSA